MTEPLTLRPLSVADADAMVGVLADPALYDFTGGRPPTVEELSRRYAVQAVGRSPDGAEQWLNRIVLLGVERKPVGYVQATVPVGGDVAEIAWVIGVPWQGRGLGRRAACLLLEELAGRGVRTVIAHIRQGHVASEGIASALGMTVTDVVVEGERRWSGSVTVR